MRQHEAERIAAAINVARPDWPTKQLLTLLSDDRINKRPRRDIFVALAWIAAEPESTAPYRVLESGPWWAAAAAEHVRSATEEPEVIAPEHKCAICSMHRVECQRRATTSGHEFLSVVDHAKVARKREPAEAQRIGDSLKGEIQPTRDHITPPTRRQRYDERVQQLTDEAAAASAEGKHGKAEYLAERAELAARRGEST